MLQELESWQRAFFWSAKEKVNGGQCLVAWESVCRPYDFGGLGVKNLRLQDLALRVRWEWLRRTDLSRPWQGLPHWKDKLAADVFHSLVKIRVGKGDRVLFWLDRWLDGACIQDIALDVLAAMGTRRQNTRTVQQALQNDRWTLDATDNLLPEGFQQFVVLSMSIINQERDPDQDDFFTWPCDPSGVFSAKATYDRLCEGAVRFGAVDCIWKPWAPSKCKIFQWPAVKNRLWTTDRRARHGLQAVANTCYLCLQEIDAVDHFLVHCCYAKEVWFKSLRDANVPYVQPSVDDRLEDWWLVARQRIQVRERSGFDARVMLTCWSIWKQRNARVF
jgi:hypothetical protein